MTGAPARPAAGQARDARPARRGPPARGARPIARDVLVRVEAGAFAHLALREALRRSELPPRDRGFATELVSGTLREQRALDRLLRRHCRRELDELDPAVRAALRIGTYQLVHGVAPHAAIGETVAVVDEKARGFVNAVLRSVLGGGFPDPTEARYVRSCYPRWVVDDLEQAYGEGDTAAILAVMNAPPAATLRVDADRVDEVVDEVTARGGTAERGELVATALVVRRAGDLAALPAVRAGHASIQDQASQAVAMLVGARPGERVLDLCAAPGGKANALAEVVGAEGRVVACDVHEGRIRTLVRGARLRPALVAVVADGRRPPFVPGSFDRVLLDAPCSGLGVLRRRADARHRVTRELVAQVAELQRGLLVAAAALVRPGGRLVYSVCTLTRAETVGIDAFAASELPELVAAEPPGVPWRPAGRGAVLLPHAAGTDGMFVLILERRDDR